MKSQITPGPWEMRVDYSGCPYVASQYKQMIADVNNAFVSAKEALANARLIAAAPSMYDALAAIANMQTQETTEWWELATLCISIAKIEIAKLEGKP